MKFSAALCISARLRSAWLLCLLSSFPAVAMGHETSQKVADPGFRPDSENAQTFIEALATSRIAIYPTLVRRATRTAVSFGSQDLIVKMLGNKAFGSVVAKGDRLDLGRLQGSSQWDIFNDDMKRIADELTRRPPAEDFLFIMEILLPVSDQHIFGVHVYVLDQKGQNVFSFLLNSHHQSFIEA